MYYLIICGQGRPTHQIDGRQLSETCVHSATTAAITLIKHKEALEDEAKDCAPRPEVVCATRAQIPLDAD
jgi:hypothetical protein